MDTEYQAWKKQPSPQTMSTLLRAATPTIDSAVTSYAGGDKSLRGHAKLLAMEAFDSFDPKKSKLQTHLMNQLQPLRRVAQSYRQSVHVPERVEHTGKKLFDLSQELEDSLGREPSDAELADHAKMSIKKIRKIRRYLMPVAAESMFSGEGDDDDNSDSMPGVSRPDPEKIWMDYVYHDLSPIDKKILEWKTGAYGHPVLPTQDIARRLGVTSGAVSQRAAKISARLTEGAGVDV